MTFHSILFEGSDGSGGGAPNEAPSFFADLNLDQFIESLTADWKEYDLTPFYYRQLTDLDAIAYRQDVMQDLANQRVTQAVESFSGRMRTMRERLDQGKKFYYKHASQRCFLSAIEVYCGAVERLTLDLCEQRVESQGLLAFRDYLARYASSLPFRTLVTEMKKLKTDLSAIRYCLLLKADAVTVLNSGAEGDYSASVEETFRKFRRTEEKNYWVSLREMEGVNHIQEQILDGVAKLHPGTFAALETFFTSHHVYLDEMISRFDREIQFYLAFLRYIEKLRATGLSFCRPQLVRATKEIAGRDSFDIVLARKLIDDKATVVCNDFFLSGGERIFVVSGPNHGGKTTFARMFGQMHYLASLGLLVPGREARLFLFDRLFTHFEREEDISNLRGKLQDDLMRIRQILDEATPNSIVIMNEIFSSTTLQDAIYLSKQIVAQLSALDLLGVCVTFLDELASFDKKTVSVVSTVDPDNPAVRTFKLERKPADGLAYALAIAQKHRVTYELLKERIKA
jgi:DNA mismatch repair protein MutS